MLTLGVVTATLVVTGFILIMVWLVGNFGVERFVNVVGALASVSGALFAIFVYLRQRR